MNKPMGSKASDTMNPMISETMDRFEEESMNAAPGDLSYSFDEKVKW
jgi:hypothetical protein